MEFPELVISILFIGVVSKFLYKFVLSKLEGDKK